MKCGKLTTKMAHPQNATAMGEGTVEEVRAGAVAPAAPAAAAAEKVKEAGIVEIKKGEQRKCTPNENSAQKENEKVKVDG